jgi:hypothetical protein
MGTPTNPVKKLMAAGAKKAATWGTAVAVGATDGLLLKGDGGLERKQPYIAAKELDTPFVQVGDLGAVEPVDFAPSFTMRYDPGAIGVLLAQLFGTAGAPTKQGVTSAYKHTIKWADSNSGKFSTFVVERPGKILEVPSAKPYKFSFGFSDGVLDCSIGLRGNNLIDNSVVNQATQVDALTYADRKNRIFFKQLTAKMNDQTGGALTAETALPLSICSGDIERALDAPFAAGSETMSEPEDGPHPSGTLKLDFLRANAATQAFFSKFTGETLQKLSLSFVGAVIETTYHFEFNLVFPQARIISYNSPLDDIIPVTVELAIEEAGTKPTGMDDTRPYLELVNARSTDYLA